MHVGDHNGFLKDLQYANWLNSRPNAIIYASMGIDPSTLNLRLTWPGKVSQF